MFMAISAIVLIGVGMVLLLRSPLRAPIGERFFRMIWLGPFGRAFLRFSARGAIQTTGMPRPLISASHATAARKSAAASRPVDTASGATTPPPAPVPVPTDPTAAPPRDSLARSLRELAERVAELESAVNRNR
jgi:hypothetical protein